MDKTDFSAFGQYIPGFDFLQSLARQATGVTPGQSAAGVMPSLGHWVAPTFSVEEIEKRIHDLRAVEFWLDQNAKALAATIQALEVQKMTLATLENMNLSLQDVAESFKIKPEAVQARAAPPRPAKAAEPPVQEAAPSAQAESKTGVDPLQWWNSLTEQFTTIASSAVQDMAGQAAKAAEQVAQTVQASAEAAEKMAEQARQDAAAAAMAAVQAGQQAADAATGQRPKAPAKKSAATAAKKAAPSRSRSKPAAE